MKRFFMCIAFISCLSSPGLKAQTIEDALGMSVRNYFTSARVVGTGSAMGAIGGDYGAININPANIGTFRNSYFTISLGLNSIKSASRWNENSIASSDNNNTFLTLPNLGFIISAQGGGKWKVINFGIGFNRVRNNASFIQTSGTTPGSIVQRWAYLANQVIDPNNFDQFELLPAYESYALGQGIDQDGNVFYFSDYGNNDYLYKEVYEKIEGGVNEISLSLGGNYEDKLLVGLNLGIPFYKNSGVFSYYEADSDPDNLYKSVTYEKTYETSGVGFNFGFGAIYMPVYKVRIGVSFQSPTWYGISDNHRSRVKFDYYDPDNSYVPSGTDTDIQSQPGYFDYSFTSPWRMGAQLGWIIGNHGFIDVEADYVNYSTGSFNYKSFNYQDAERDMNARLADELGSALTIRAGGEWALNELRFRLGVGLQQSPYKNDKEFQMIYSGGLGFRGDYFYIDIAYRYRQLQGTFYPYYVNSSSDIVQPELHNAFRHNNFVLTVGFSI